MHSINKILTSALTGILLFAGSVATLYSTELTLYIWDEYISAEVLNSFREKTGITVNLVHFDSDKTRDEVVASARGKQFDIVLFDSVSAQIFGKNNQLLALNTSEIPNFSHIDKRWQESCGNFGVPYFYGTVGLVYDRTRYTEPPQSWGDLLWPKKDHRGQVVMVEDLADTLLPALLYLGYSINSENESELRAAYNILQKQTPAVLNYTYALTNIKAAGESRRMDLALAYSGDQYTINEATGTESWAYVIPREGTAIWMDCLSVTAWSKNRKEALDFLNYLNDPQIAGENAEAIYGATPISAARKFMSKAMADDAELFPTEEILQQGQMYRILSDNNMRQRGRILDTLLKIHASQ